MRSLYGSRFVRYLITGVLLNFAGLLFIYIERMLFAKVGIKDIEFWSSSVCYSVGSIINYGLQVRVVHKRRLSDSGLLGLILFVLGQLILACLVGVESAAIERSFQYFPYISPLQLTAIAWGVSVVTMIPLSYFLGKACVCLPQIVKAKVVF